MAFPVAAAIAGGAAITSGVLSFLSQKSAADRAEAIYNDAMQKWLDIHIPDPEQQKVVLDKFVQQGELDPILMEAIQQDPSAFEQIITDPRNKQAQNRALSELERLGYEGGLSLQDKADLQEATLAGTARDRENRKAITADMARKGMNNSGFELQSQLSGQQSEADRLSNERLKVAAQARDRALASIMGAGQLGTQYRAQEFGEKSKIAEAKDAINKFNTQNLRDVQAFNTGLRNETQRLNLAEKQRIADQNTQLSNAEQMYNKGLAQQKYENELKRMAGATGQAAGMANSAMAQGQATANTISNIGGAVVGGATAYQKQQNDMDWLDRYFENKKKAGV